MKLRRRFLHLVVLVEDDRGRAGSGHRHRVVLGKAVTGFDREFLGLFPEPEYPDEDGCIVAGAVGVFWTPFIVWHP